MENVELSSYLPHWSCNFKIASLAVKEAWVRGCSGGISSAICWAQDTDVGLVSVQSVPEAGEDIQLLLLGSEEVRLPLA